MAKLMRNPDLLPLFQLQQQDPSKAQELAKSMQAKYPVEMSMLGVSMCSIPVLLIIGLGFGIFGLFRAKARHWQAWIGVAGFLACCLIVGSALSSIARQLQVH